MPSLLLLFLSAAFGGADWPELAWDEAPARVSLVEVVEEAEVFLGEEVRFVAQVSDRVSQWEGLLTPFQPGTHRGLALWPDEALLWQQEAYDAPLLTTFVRRDSRWAARAERLRPHDRVLVTGRVRSCLAGRPWIEVTRILRTREQVPEGTVLHAIRAGEMVERGALDLALAEVERALAAPLPERPRVVLEAFRAGCQRLTSRLESGWRPTERELRQERRRLAEGLKGKGPEALMASWRRHMRLLGGVAPRGPAIPVGKR